MLLCGLGDAVVLCRRQITLGTLRHRNLPGYGSRLSWVKVVPLTTLTTPTRQHCMAGRPWSKGPLAGANEDTMSL